MHLSKEQQIEIILKEGSRSNHMVAIEFNRNHGRSIIHDTVAKHCLFFLCMEIYGPLVLSVPFPCSLPYSLFLSESSPHSFLHSLSHTLFFSLSSTHYSSHFLLLSHFLPPHSLPCTLFSALSFSLSSCPVGWGCRIH